MNMYKEDKHVDPVKQFQAMVEFKVRDEQINNRFAKAKTIRKTKEFEKSKYLKRLNQAKSVMVAKAQLEFHKVKREQWEQGILAVREQKIMKDINKANVSTFVQNNNHNPSLLIQEPLQNEEFVKFDLLGDTQIAEYFTNSY